MCESYILAKLFQDIRKVIYFSSSQIAPRFLNATRNYVISASFVIHLDVLHREAKAGGVSGHDINNLILRRAASLRAQREHERNDSQFEKSRGHFATLCR